MNNQDPEILKAILSLSDKIDKMITRQQSITDVLTQLTEQIKSLTETLKTRLIRQP